MCLLYTVFGHGQTLTTQAEVDALNQADITNTVVIRSGTVDPITNIDALSSLTQLSGTLIIEQNDELEHIDGLANLLEITGTLTILNNDRITDIDALSNLSDIEGALSILDNDGLLNIDGLASLTEMTGSLDVDRNDALTNIDALSNLSDVAGTLQITRNHTLGSIDPLSNLTSITGSLVVTNNDGLTEVDGLNGLTDVLGSLTLSGNESLTNIDGLNNLTSVTGSLIIRYNRVLPNIDGLANLDLIDGQLEISDNDALTDIDGFNNLNEIAGQLNISENDALTNIDGLNNLTGIAGRLELIRNRLLTSIDGLTNLIDVQGSLVISFNDALPSVDGLTSLTDITGHLTISLNSSLTHIDGLANLSDISGHLTIESNPVLTDCCGLYTVLNRPGGVSGTINLQDNPFACSSISDITSTNCELRFEAVARPPCTGIENGGFDIIVGGTFSTPLYYSWTRRNDGVMGSGSSAQNPFFIGDLGEGTYDISVWTSTPRDTHTLDSLVLQGQMGNTFEVFEIMTTSSSNGLSNGSIILQYRGGQPAYAISWSGAASGSASGILADSFEIGALPPGTYNIIITDELNRQLLVSITLLDETVPIIPCEEPLDIVILNDVSGSVDPTEYGQSKQFFINLLWAVNIGEGMEDSRATMVEWAGGQRIVIPMTGSMADLEGYLSADRSFEGGTYPLGALQFGSEYLAQVARTDVQRVLILSTDASAGQVPPALLDLAEEYKAAGYHIVTIAFGLAYSDPFTRAFLRQVASINLLAPGAPNYADLNRGLAEQLAHTYLCPIDPGSSASSIFNRDGAIQIIDAALVGNCPYPSEVEVTIALSASRELSLPAGTPVTFYHNDPLVVGAIPILTWRLPCALTAGTSGTFRITLPISSPTHLYAVLNDDARQGTPFSWPVTDIEEVNYMNNADDTLICVGIEALVQASKQALNPYPICDTTITYAIDICNSSLTDAFDVVVQDEAPSGFNLLYTTISDGDCAVDHGDRYDIPAGCCLSLYMTYDVSGAAPGFYDDQDVILSGPANQIYVAFDGNPTNQEDVIISDSIDCLSTEIDFRKEVSVDTSCSDRYLTYTFFVDNKTSTQLSNLVLTDDLAPPGNWAFRPYDARGMRIENYAIDGARIEVVIGDVLPDTVAQFSLDVYIDETDQAVTLSNVAMLDQVPDLTNRSLRSLRSNAVQTLILPAPSISMTDTIYVSTLDSAVMLEADIMHGDTVVWISEGDGVFSDNTNDLTQYVFGERDLMDSIISMLITVTGRCGEVDQPVIIVRVEPDTCMLSFTQFAISDCDDNGTPEIIEDDTFEVTFSVEAEENGSSTAYTVVTEQRIYGPYPFGTLETITLPADGSQIALQFIDEMDSICHIDTVVSTSTCSHPCDLDVQVDLTDVSCPDVANGTIQFEVTSASSTSFTYSLGDLYSDTIENGVQVIEGLSAGSYQLTIQDIDHPHCQFERVVVINTEEAISLDVKPDTTIDQGNTVQIESITNRPAAILSWSWNPNEDLDCTDCPEPIARPQFSTIYTATVTDSAGCSATASLNIVVIETIVVYIPNAFSPNGDGINDAFTIYRGETNGEVVSFRIYNRWGGIVHERYGISFQGESAQRLAWDGYVNGSLASTGVYVYQAVIRTRSGTEETLTGEVHLIR